MLLLEMKFILTHEKCLRADYISLIFTRTRGASTCVTIDNNNSNRFFSRVLNFQISGSIRRKKKCLKRENVPWFKLLLEMKFILTRQT